MRAGKRAAAKAAGELRYFTGIPCIRGHVAPRRTSDGVCVVCARAAVRAYEQKRVPNIAARLRERHLKALYGISPQQYDEMLAAQDTRCAICRSPDPADRWNRFHVDHEHATGLVRGLLCGNCNTGLGKFKDDPQILQTAINYLQSVDIPCR